MDSNKLEKLRSIGYRIRGKCGTCKHRIDGLVTMHEGGYGTCSIHEYEHQKHTDACRKVTIYVDGYCNDYEWDGDIPHGFGEFVEDTPMQEFMRLAKVCTPAMSMMAAGPDHKEMSDDEQES